MLSLMLSWQQTIMAGGRNSRLVENAGHPPYAAAARAARPDRQVRPHLDAEQLYELAKQRDPKMNRVTVYRTLKMLKDGSSMSST